MKRTSRSSWSTHSIRYCTRLGQRLVRFVSCSGRVSTRDQLAGQLVLSLHADARALRIASFPVYQAFLYWTRCLANKKFIATFSQHSFAYLFLFGTSKFQQPKTIGFRSFARFGLFQLSQFFCLFFWIFSFLLLKNGFLTRNCRRYFWKLLLLSLCVMVSLLSLFRLIDSFADYVLEFQQVETYVSRTRFMDADVKQREGSYAHKGITLLKVSSRDSIVELCFVVCTKLFFIGRP